MSTQEVKSKARKGHRDVSSALVGENLVDSVNSFVYAESFQSSDSYCHAVIRPVS